MATKVSPNNGVEDVKNWGDVTENKPHRRLSVMRKMDTVHHKALEIADETMVSLRPHFSTKDTRTHIKTHVVLKKIRKLDFVNSSVDLLFIVSMQWEYPELINKTLDVTKLWTPDVACINADNLRVEYETPWYYPEHAVIRQNVIFQGTIGNESSFKDFPFDNDCFKIIVVLEIDTGDDIVKLMYDPSKTIDDVLPEYNSRQQNEYTLHRELTMVRRPNVSKYVNLKTRHQRRNAMPQLNRGPSGFDIRRRDRGFHLMGEYSAVEITIHVSRDYGFYLWKIMLILTMICVVSWICFFLDNFGERINMSLTLFLSAIAFLYIVSDSLPKLGFLTTMDKMVLACFVNIFFTIIETFLAFHVFKDKETRKVMDEGSKYLFPIMFLLSTYGNMFFSLYKRHKDFQETKKNFRPGISNDLL